MSKTLTEEKVIDQAAVKSQWYEKETFNSQHAKDGLRPVYIFVESDVKQASQTLHELNTAACGRAMAARNVEDDGWAR